MEGKERPKKKAELSAVVGSVFNRGSLQDLFLGIARPECSPHTSLRSFMSKGRVKRGDVLYTLQMVSATHCISRIVLGQASVAQSKNREGQEVFSLPGQLHHVMLIINVLPI